MKMPNLKNLFERRSKLALAEYVARVDISASLRCAAELAHDQRIPLEELVKYLSYQYHDHSPHLIVGDI